MFSNTIIFLKLINNKYDYDIQNFHLLAAIPLDANSYKKNYILYESLWKALIFELAGNTTILPGRSQLVYWMVGTYLYLTFSSIWC